jgi:hypothetical protein
MLLEQKVEVKWCPTNRTYYESLGFVYKHRGVIEIDANLLLPNSRVKVKVRCDYCNKIYETNNVSLNRAKYKEKHSCEGCRRLKVFDSNQHFYGVNSTTQIKDVSQRQMQTRKKLYDKLYGGAERTCSVCGKSYPNTVEYFPPNKNSGYGLIKRCRSCHNKKIREIYKPRYKDRIKIYRAKNSEKFNMYRHKRRSQKESLAQDYNMSLWEECKIYFKCKCAYCGSNENLSQEHFVPVSKNGEYTKNNIIPACGSCNSSKCGRDFFEWYPKQPFYSKKRERKILKYLNYDPKTKYQQIAL